MGKTGLYLKIAILLVGLGVVFFAMRSMTTDKVQGAFQALGIEPGADGQPGLQPGGQKLGEGETRRTLCQTRVHAVRFPDGRTIIERKKGLNLDWLAQDEPTAEITGRTLNYLAVEKWFSLHCQFSATPAGPPSDQEFEPSNEPVKYVLVEFIDGTKWELYRSGHVLFSAADPKDRFESPDLEQALDELKAIAAFPVDSKDR